ncbi:hypothetical protein TRFO_04659 [Tritrichomonas foetus]|uniref:Uncharacterized protein n=1 Tax=Tritrichomonas foetus TaxID=1144522 RepID=A0A1J4KDU5_9EUKA|nr:hypothetical protein TRFO_04659 [Tritrichomonas foetus]|eukprot:OHT09080.1 hypothetical protein TRFO_04659 [Tritrichomonas foetus]
MNLNEEISQEEVQKVEEINELMKSFGADSDNDEFLLNNDGIDTRIDDKINHLLTDKLPNDRNKPIIRPEDLKKGIFSSDDLEEEEEEEEEDKNEQKQNQQKFPNDIHNNLEIEENKEEVEDKNEKVKSVNSNDQKYEDIQLEFEKKFMKQLDKPKIESYLDGSDKSEDMIADESDISDYQECDIADDELLQMGSLRTGVKGDFDLYSEDEETDDYDGDWLANNTDEAFIPSKTHVQNQNDAKPENYLKLESKNEEEEYQYSDNEEIPLDPIKKLTINEDDFQSKNDSKLESKNIENSDVDTGDDEILKSEELRSIIRNYGLNDDEEEDGNNTEDLIRRLENIGASPKKSNDNEITLENAFNEEEEEASLIIKPDNKNETSNFDLDAKSTPLKNEIPINLDNDDEISDFLKNENNVNDITPNPPNSPRLEGENEEHIDPKREPKSELKSDIKKEPQNDELVDENSSDSDDASIDAIIKDASAKGYIQSDDEDEEEEEEELFIQENKTPTSRFKKQLKFIFNSIKIGSEMSNGGIDITNECAEKILRIQLKSVLGL